MESALVEWVKDQYPRRVFISGDLIKEQGRRVCEKVNENLPENERIDLKFSNGLLTRFKARNNFQKQNSHGESGDADDAAIQRDLPGIKEHLLQYAVYDVWNADEFGLFYRMAPTSAISRAPLPWRNQQKTRIT